MENITNSNPSIGILLELRYPVSKRNHAEGKRQGLLLLKSAGLVFATHRQFSNIVCKLNKDNGRDRKYDLPHRLCPQKRLGPCCPALVQKQTYRSKDGESASSTALYVTNTGFLNRRYQGKFLDDSGGRG